MLTEYSRTQLLLGKENIQKLFDAKVAVFGVGGVGSYVVEALARAGVGTIAIFDNDTVSITNINRQLIATHKTVGRVKVEAAKERILEINPRINVEAYRVFYTALNAGEYDLSKYNYVVDAIDTVSAKLTIIENAKKCNVPVISSMGTGNKLDPTKFEIADISKTSVCPLAKVMRSELKRRNIKKVKVLYSKENPLKPLKESGNMEEIPKGRRQIPGSISFVPSVAGLIIASEVIKDIVKFEKI